MYTGNIQSTNNKLFQFLKLLGSNTDGTAFVKCKNAYPDMTSIHT